MAGRIPGLTPELQEKICMAIRGGNYRSTAARWAGVPIRTFTLWSKKGREEDEGIYRDFWLAILEAEKAAEVNCVRIVMKAAEADAKHAQWWLERKFPKKWGRKDRREVTKTVEHTHEIKTELPLSECIAIYQKAIEAKKAEGGQEHFQAGGSP